MSFKEFSSAQNRPAKAKPAEASKDTPANGRPAPKTSEAVPPQSDGAPPAR